MSTLPPPETERFPESSLEKKVYNIVEKFGEYLPIANDRNRLGFSLFKFVTGEGDDPAKLVHTAKIKIVGISPEELAKKISSELKNIKESE